MLSLIRSSYILSDYYSADFQINLDSENYLQWRKGMVYFWLYRGWVLCFFSSVLSDPKFHFQVHREQKSLKILSVRPKFM